MHDNIINMLLDNVINLHNNVQIDKHIIYLMIQHQIY